MSITDSTIAQRFPLKNYLCPLHTSMDTIEKQVSICVLVFKGLPIDGVGVSRDTVYQERREWVLGLKPAIS